jgi:hypothetical protein
MGLGALVAAALVPSLMGAGDGASWTFVVSAVIALLGLFLALDRRVDWRIGSGVALIAGGWFLLATQVLIPRFNGVGRFYDAFFGPELGESPREIARNIARHPSLAVERATESTRVTWYWRMLAPFAVVPLLYLRALAIAAPMIVVNVLTLFPYTRDYRFHYSALVVAGCAVATVEGIGLVQRVAAGNVTVRNVCVGIVLGAALWTSVLWGASPLALDYENIWPLQADPRQAVQAHAVDLVPADAAVSAPYNLVPHMTHRVRVYEFPVPWCNINWGVEGENLDDPAEIEWLVLDRRLLTDPQNAALAADLLGSEFAVRFEELEIVVAERTAPSPSRSEVPPQFQCTPR